VLWQQHQQHKRVIGMGNRHCRQHTTHHHTTAGWCFDKMPKKQTRCTANNPCLWTPVGAVKGLPVTAATPLPPGIQDPNPHAETLQIPKRVA
jgi:hypothetical protein